MGRPLASAPEPTDAEGQPVARLRCIPEDPVTPLLTEAGAPLLDAGKIDLSAYEDLKRHFAREPLAEAHPDPGRPGVRGDETKPKGLRMWDDIKTRVRKGLAPAGQNGAGWIAHYSSRQEPSKERWFNIQTCGSWRLAFLLARLQLRVWQRGCHSATQVPPESRPAAPVVSARRITGKRRVESAEVAAEAAAAAEPEPPKGHEEPPPCATPKPLMESSARLQQLLGRVRAKEACKEEALPKPSKETPQELLSKVSLLLAAAGENSPPPKRGLREPDSGQKLAKQPRLA